MNTDKFNHTAWDACRFYNFFWLWASPAYWLISDHIENGTARRAEGLNPPYLFLAVVLLSLLAGSYFLTSLKPRLKIREPYASEVSPFAGNTKFRDKLKIFGGFVCYASTAASGFIIQNLIYPDDLASQLRFPISEGFSFAICVMLFTNGGIFSLFYCASNAD